MVQDQYAFLNGGGIMGEQIRNFAWEETPMGPISQWQDCLKQTISLVLTNRFPMLILWGEELIQIHNDAFIPSLLHQPNPPPALGKKSEEYWRESWSLVEPLIHQVIETGDSVFNVDQAYPSYRDGAVQLAYWTYSYSQIKNGQGLPSGLMVTCIETTEKVKSFQALEEAEQRIRLALDAVEMGTFELQYDSNTLITSPRFDQIMGAGPLARREDYIAIFHPEDLPERARAHEQSLLSGHLLYRARVVVDNIIRWVQIEGKVFFNADKKAERMFGIILDITQKRNAEQDLVRTNDRLSTALKNQKNLQRQKDGFLKIASHEFKTPLTSIKGYGQLVEEILREKGNMQECIMLEKLNTKVDHLHSLIEDLLDVSEFSDGQLKFKETSFNLTELLGNLAEDMKLITNKPLITEFTPGNFTVYADKDRITQVVTNLISNAIKYSLGPSEIHLNTRLNKKELVVEIRDFGLGIAHKDQKKVFDQFFRASDQQIASSGGLGLGLYISAEIIKHHGGRIWLQSSLGKGSTFSFSLPIETPKRLTG